MSISGYLLPFPDPGAADLMSDHLEQVVQTTGPGKILVTTSLPEILTKGLENPSGLGSRFARKNPEKSQGPRTAQGRFENAQK